MTDVSLFLQTIENETEREQVGLWMDNYYRLNNSKLTPAVCLFFGLAMTIAELIGAGFFLFAGIPVSIVSFAWLSTLTRRQVAERERIRAATGSNFPDSVS